MKNRNLNAGRVLAVLVVLAMVPGIVTCDHEGAESLLILDVKPALRKNQCTIQVGGSVQDFLSHGVMDLMLTNQYWAHLHFRNMLQPINTITGEGPTTPENEVHYLSIQRAKVFVNIGEFAPKTASDKAGISALREFQLQGVESFTSSWAAPQSEATTSVQLIPPKLGNFLGTKMKAAASANIFPAVWVTAYVSLWAETQDQNVIKSNEFSFPIQLCYGCLVRPYVPEEASLPPCDVGQEEPIDPQFCPYVAVNPGDCPDL